MGEVLSHLRAVPRAGPPLPESPTLPARPSPCLSLFQYFARASLLPSSIHLYRFVCVCV